MSIPHMPESMFHILSPELSNIDAHYDNNRTDKLSSEAQMNSSLVVLSAFIQGNNHLSSIEPNPLFWTGFALAIGYWFLPEFLYPP